ncbi:MAG: alkaline phosphatase family protein [Deltaproteobacteria bacterium]|nr:alkaline phosphatase family protein [Deltaproteobacteria bacterium]
MKCMKDILYKIFHPKESFYRYLSTFSEGCIKSKGKRFIIIHIDGLSYFALRRALKFRFMPFITKLLNSQTHKIARFDCGLPATTPAFMAGIMYGDNSNIPGFRWYDKERKEFIIMKSLNDTGRLEQELSKNEGILTDGTSYCTLFTGGAKESVFAVSKLYELNRYIKINFVTAILLMVFNMGVVLRIVFSMVTELISELKEYIIQTVRKEVRRSEVPFIPIRLITNVLLREISTILAEVDIYRGVSSIYIDYVGYDELAHHRGPLSLSSLITLYSIDRDIKKLFKAIKKSGNQYEVYILSDHGQVPTLPFDRVGGQSFEDYIIKEVIGTRIIYNKGNIEYLREQRQLSFLNYLQSIRQSMPRGFGYIADVLIERIKRRVKESIPEVDVTDLNQIFLLPTSDLAHLYFNKFDRRLLENEIEYYYPNIKEIILAHGNIAAITYLSEEGVIVETPEGKALISEGNIKVLRGSVSSFFSLLYKGIESDIERLTKMKNSGDIIIFAGRFRGRVLNFQEELGGHGGPYPEEQSAFIIFPRDKKFNFYRIRNSTQLYNFFKKEYRFYA